MALIGLRGAGKTTLGEQLAHHYKQPFVRLDEVISRLAGLEMGDLRPMDGNPQPMRDLKQILAERSPDYGEFRCAR